MSQLALTCHGLLILQIAAIRHIDVLDFSAGALKFIGIQTVPVDLHRLYESFIRPHLDYVSIVWNPHLKGEIESLVCTKVCPLNLFEMPGFCS